MVLAKLDLVTVLGKGIGLGLRPLLMSIGIGFSLW
jgi:hypothetical protein